MAEPGVKLRAFGAETWAKGHRGRLSPWSTDKPALLDCRVNSGGNIIPRPAWRPTLRTAGPFIGQQTTIPTTATSFQLVPGRYTHTGSVQNGHLWTTTTNTIWTLDFDTFQTVAPGVAQFFHQGWFRSVEDYLFVVSTLLVNTKGTTGAVVATDIAAALDSRFSGANSFFWRGSEVHHGRTYMWGYMLNGSNYTTAENTLYYSDLYDYDTFTSATQFLQIDGAIAGARSLGNSLLIWSDNGEWFALQAREDPTAGTLTRLGPNRVPCKGVQPAVYDGTLIFPSSDHLSLVVVQENGTVDDRTLAHLAFSGSDEGYEETANSPPTVASSLNNNVLVVGPTPNQHFHLSRGVWTEESWSTVPNVGSTVGARMSLYFSTEHLIAYGASNHPLFQRQGTIDEPEEKPAASPVSEVVVGSVTLPRVFTPAKQVRVRRVIVDGRYWKGASFYDPYVTVGALDGQATVITTADMAQSDDFDSFPDQEGGAFRLTYKPTTMPDFTSYTDITLTFESVEISNVVVEFEESEQELVYA